MLTTFLLLNEKIDRYSIIFLIFFLFGISTYSIYSYGISISLYSLVIYFSILIFMYTLIKKFNKIKDKLIIILLIGFWLFVVYQLKYTYELTLIWSIVTSLPILIVSFVWTVYALLFYAIYIDIFLFNYIAQILVDLIK